jgi:hypothetical protein
MEHTCAASFKMKLEEWISTLAPIAKIAPPYMLYVPRQEIEKFQELSADHHSSTYPGNDVGVEGRIIDNKSSIINVDGSTVLKVACARQELERKFQIVLFAGIARMELKSSAKES